MAVAASSTPGNVAGFDHRLEKWLFPQVGGWPRAVLLYLYYLGIIVALLLIYGRGDFTVPPFVYQGF